MYFFSINQENPLLKRCVRGQGRFGNSVAGVQSVEVRRDVVLHLYRLRFVSYDNYDRLQEPLLFIARGVTARWNLIRRCSFHL